MTTCLGVSRCFTVGIAAFCLSAASVFADPILSLYNTGTGTAGSVDSHYTIIWTPSGSTTPLSAYITEGSPASYPFDTWEDNDSTSKWISPQASYPPATGDANGIWTFQTTFNLSGFQTSTVIFTDADFWTSNTVTSIMLNGIDVLPTGVGGGPSSPSSFVDNLNQMIADEEVTLNSGVNIFAFTVDTTGAGTIPAGLRVELAAEATPVPEPTTTVALACAGAVLLCGRRKRWRDSNIGDRYRA